MNGDKTKLYDSVTELYGGETELNGGKMELYLGKTAFCWSEVVPGGLLVMLSALILIKKLLRFLKYLHLNIYSGNYLKFEEFISVSSNT